MANLVASLTVAQPHRRQWRDISKKRLLLGLAVAPLGPFLIGAALIALFDSWSPMYLPIIGGILAAAEVWSLVGGGAYLFLVSRWRGAVRRAECFLLGICLAALLPFAAEFASVAVDHITGQSEFQGSFAEDEFEGPSDFEFAMVVSLLLVPFGALGGWVFWRVGVRPARPHVGDVAPVFD